MGEDHVAEVEPEAHVEENRDEVVNKEEQQNISTESGDESGKNVAEASDVTPVDPIENAGASKTDEKAHVGEEKTVEDNEPEQPVAEEEKLEHDGGSTEEVHDDVADGATSSNIESIPADDQTTDPPETGVAADGVVDEPASGALESNDAVVPTNASDGIHLDAGEQQQVPGEGANIGADESQEDATHGVNEEPLVGEEDNEKHETEAVQDTPALEVEEGKPEHDDGSTEVVHDDLADKVGGTSDEVDASSSNVEPETGVADDGVVDEPASAASESNDPVVATDGIVSDAGEQQQDSVEEAKDISIGVDEPAAVSSQEDETHGVNEEPVAGSEEEENEKLQTEAVEDTLAIEVEEGKPEVGGTGNEVGATSSNTKNTSDDQTSDPLETGVAEDDGVVDEPASAPLDPVVEAKDISTGIDEPAAVSSQEEVTDEPVVGSGKEENEKRETEAIEAAIEGSTPTDGIHSEAGEPQVFEEEVDVQNTGADEPVADVSSREAEIDAVNDEPEAGTGEAGNENSEVQNASEDKALDGPGGVVVQEADSSATVDETTEQATENFSENVQEADSSATVGETQQPSENLSSEEPVPEKVDADEEHVQVSGDSGEDQVGVIEDRGIDPVTGEEPEHGSAPADEHVDAVSGGETSEHVSAAEGTRSLDGAVEFHVEDVPAVDSSGNEGQAVQEDPKATETDATDAAPEEGDKVSEAPEQEAEELLPLSNESRFDEKNVGDESLEVPVKLIRDGNVEEEAEEVKEAEENNASILVSEAGDAGGAVDDTKNADERSFVGTPEKSFDEGLLLAAAGSGDQNDQGSEGDDKLAEAETLVGEDVQEEVTPSDEETEKEAAEVQEAFGEEQESSVDEGLVPEVDQESPGGDQAENDSSIVEDSVIDAGITEDDPEKAGEDSLLSQSKEVEASTKEEPEKETGEQNAVVGEQAPEETGFVSETSKDPADVLHPEEIDGDKAGDRAATEATSETGTNDFSQVPHESSDVKAAHELKAEIPVQKGSTGEAAGDEVSNIIGTKGVTEELEGEKLENITESVPKELEFQIPEESNEKQAPKLNGEDVEGIKLPAEHEVDQQAVEERDIVETIQPKENLSSPDDDEAEDDKENSSLQAEAEDDQKLKQEPGSGITPPSFFNKIVSAAMNVAKATKPSKKKRLRMKKELQAKLQAVST